jgi:hypothetical protein
MKKGANSPLFYMFRITASNAATTAANAAIITGPLVVAHAVAARIRAHALLSKVQGQLGVEMATALAVAMIAGHGPSVSRDQGRQANRSWQQFL